LGPLPSQAWSEVLSKRRGEGASGPKTDRSNEQQVVSAARSFYLWIRCQSGQSHGEAAQSPPFHDGLVEVPHLQGARARRLEHRFKIYPLAGDGAAYQYLYK